MNACVKYYTAKHHSLTKEIFDYDHNKSHSCGNSPQRSASRNGCDDTKFANLQLKPKMEEVQRRTKNNDCSVSMTMMKDEKNGGKCSTDVSLDSCGWTMRDVCRSQSAGCCRRRESNYSSTKEFCSNKFIQIVIVLLVMIMAFWWVFI